KQYLKVAAVLAFVSAMSVNNMVHAQYTGEVIKIGVLSDMSSVYSDLTGVGSVAAAKLAVQDFDPASHGIKVEIAAPITKTNQTSGRTSRDNGSMLTEWM